jgi:5'-phosphate synthase pdxT subunit
VLARLQDGTAVAAREGTMLASSFHPELTDDTRLHEYFLDIVRAAHRSSALT